MVRYPYSTDYAIPTIHLDAVIRFSSGWLSKIDMLCRMVILQWYAVLQHAANILTLYFLLLLCALYFVRCSLYLCICCEQSWERRVLLVANSLDVIRGALLKFCYFVISGILKFFFFFRTSTSGTLVYGYRDVSHVCEALFQVLAITNYVVLFQSFAGSFKHTIYSYYWFRDIMCRPYYGVGCHETTVHAVLFKRLSGHWAYMYEVQNNNITITYFLTILEIVYKCLELSFKKCLGAMQNTGLSL
jgi:hypothetical protein